MDLLIIQRKPIRCSFTKACNNLKKNLLDSEPKLDVLEIHMANIERLSKSLEELDNKICDTLLQDISSAEKYEAEYEVIEEYREKFVEAQVAMKTYLSNLNKSVYEPEILAKKTKLKLPKIEFLKFGGDVKDWLAFWSQFSRIHNDLEMAQEDKFQYLIQSMTPGSRAREIVDSFPPTAENYEKAVEALKGRFGREELLIEFYVRELLALVIRNAMSTKSKLSTAQLYDKLESHLRALESIGMTSDKYAAMLFPLVESCIPEEILRVWLRNPVVIGDDKNSYNEKLKNLLLFLRTEVEGEERICLARTGFKQEKIPKVESTKGSVAIVPTANELIIGSKPVDEINCVFCGKNHKSEKCFKAQKMPVSEKLELLKQKKSCFTCLRIGHRSKHCKSNVRCLVCSKRHLVVMCPEITKNNAEKERKETIDNTLSNQCFSEVFLQTLLVRLSFGEKEKIVRVLVDTGSQRSYILDTTVREMGFSPLSTEMLTQVVFGGGTVRKKHTSYNVTLDSLHGDCSVKIQVLNQSVICGSIPRLNNRSCIEEIRRMGIPLTDVGFGQPPIEILLGSDFAGRIYTGVIKEVTDGLFAVQTCLGWMIMGKSPETQQESYGSALTSLLIQADDVTALWKLENIGITDPCETQSKEEMEVAVEKHFKETIHIDEEGRYSVSLPWMHNPEELPINREIAEKRLVSTTSKLKTLEKFVDYDNAFKSWLEDGIISDSSMDGGHFLPHRGVFKSHSTTPVRPVFDASCKQKGSLSLNDCLAKGPNLLEMIPSILFKFREKKIGVVSDIKKAFLQISVDAKDRNYLKFLWWGDQQIMKAFQHCRVVFGLTCSPYLLGAVIKQHLNQYSSSVHAKIVNKLKDAFYVDNCVTSVENEAELKDFIQISSFVMAEAKFDLRGWEHTNLQHSSTKLDPIPVLGLLWDKEDDVLFCNTSQISRPEGPVSRRTILSITHKVFDPLGIVCPVTLCPKILLQQSWKSKMSWDAEVPEEVSKTFLKWYEELKFLSEVKIPRHISLSINAKISLHVFCDASAISYASVVFLRCGTDQNISVQLLIAKSRIAPLKRMSVPRLELMACCIGARLAHFIKKNMEGYEFEEYYWTDASTALYWITHDEQWAVFVKNRVDEIRKLTKKESWRHIPGRENPADLPSRGCTVKKLVKSRWWEGPLWLKMKEENWPHSEVSAEQDEIQKEKRITVMVHATENSWIFSYFSTFDKIVKMVAWILRFIHNAKRKFGRLTGALSPDEHRKAEIKIFQLVQQESFMTNDLNRLKSLCVFKDKTGVIRVKTRLTEREDEFEFKYPVLLPNKHKLVELLIREMHQRKMHAGVHILMSVLREKYWILNGRRVIRQVISKCVQCKRYTAKPFETAPVPLPENRVRDACVFEVIGVDLAGPLILRNGKKTWIVLYTCAVFRAIHLELVTSLSTETFLLSFRRFIARRGRPSVVYSDNGTNFIGAVNMFKGINWSKVEAEATMKRIIWKFNPPSAAWWGGFWERLIQIVKKLLRRVLGNASLNYEEMITVLCDCESTVNSRPLTYVSEDPNALIPLTPAMFLQQIPMVGVPDLDQLDRVDLNKRLKYQQSLRDQLRRRFRLEYLGQLVLRHSQTKNRMVEVGEVVLIESVDKKRTFWPMARVVEIYPGKDGSVRVVKLKTSTGELIRPVQRIYPLEIQSPLERQQISEKIIERKDSQRDFSDGTVEPVNQQTKSGRQVKIPSKFKDFQL